MQGYIAFESNHEGNGRRHNILDRMYDKLDDLLLDIIEDDTVLEDEPDDLPVLPPDTEKFFKEIEKRFRKT